MNRDIPFERLHNFRDLGGYRTEDGRTVRPGRLFRADSLGKLAPGTPDWDRFLSLGIRTVVDLRYPWEIEARGRVPDHPTFTYHNQSIEHRPYNQATLAPSVDPGPYLAARYMEVAEDGTKELRETLEVIATAAAGPVAFHCASGKDRTGLVAALVLSLLGVPEETIVEDFTLTELARDRLLSDWHATNPDRVMTWPGYGRAPAQVMTLLLSTLKSRHGSIQGYVTDALGLDTPFTESLRSALLESPPARPSPPDLPLAHPLDPRNGQDPALRTDRRPRGHRVGLLQERLPGLPLETAQQHSSAVGPTRSRWARHTTAAPNTTTSPSRRRPASASPRPPRGRAAGR